MSVSEQELFGLMAIAQEQQQAAAVALERAGGPAGRAGADHRAGPRRRAGDGDSRQGVGADHREGNAPCRLRGRQWRSGGRS